MISSVGAMTTPSAAAIRVDKATSEFLIGPDWTLNIDICDIVNTNQMLAKDVVKAVKRRLQHKNPKVQLLALTLLETMVKNCGDYLHFQIAERNILPEMVKIVKKKTDMHVRDKVLMLIGSWCEAFGASRGKYPQYYMAYEELRRSGVNFPQRPPDAVPIVTPPVTHTTSRSPQPGYGMPSSSSTRLDQAMAADDNLSLSSLNSMRDVVELLADMLQAIDPSVRSSIKNEVIVDLVEQCRVNQKKLMQMLGTTGDEELLGQGLELNDNLQIVLAKHDAIASGSPIPPGVITPRRAASENQGSSLGPGEVITPDNTPPAPILPAQSSVVEEEEDEEDDFAQLARRHSKTPTDEKSDAAPSEDPLIPAMSNALVPVDFPASTRSKDQDLIDLLSLTLSTEPQTLPSQTYAPDPVSSTGPGIAFSSGTYPSSNGMTFNSYVAPWAQPAQPVQPIQPQLQYLPNPYSQPQQYPQPQFLSQPVIRAQPEYTTSMYPPPPWAATPGYFSSQNPVSRPNFPYSTNAPVSLSNNHSLNGELLVNTSPRSPQNNGGQKPFIPSYRLFEDLDVFGNADGRFKSTSNGSPNLAGPSLNGANNQNMVGGRK